MGEIEALKSFVATATRERRQAGAEAAAQGQLPFITLSRQAGAGGRSLARAILAEFETRAEDPRFQGWSIFDEELCAMIASDPEVHVSFRELLTEEYRSWAEDVVSVLLGKSFQDEVQKKISVTIRQLALVGKAILVGRGGASITRDLPRGVHVRLVAPGDVRVRWMMRVFDISQKEAGRWVEDQDRSRARMVKSRFKRDIDDPLLYDAIWNTESVPVEVIARCLAEVIASR